MGSGHDKGEEDMDKQDVGSTTIRHAGRGQTRRTVQLLAVPAHYWRNTDSPPAQ
jgi:hypothetical protein